MNNATATARALQWVVDNLDSFDPFTEGEALKIGASKPASELAVTLYCHARLNGDQKSEAVQRIVALLTRVQRNREFRDRLLRFPAEFVLFCDIYAVLRSLGHDDPEQRDLIQRVIDAGFLDVVERVPHRMMDVRLSLEWGGFRHHWPSLDTLYTASILAQVPCALYLDDATAYALTHVILFIYGFGTQLEVAAPFTDLPALRHTLSMLIVIYCQERHWDLLGEILLCWDCIGLEVTAIYDRGWKAFLATQKQDGAFPGPQPPREAEPAPEQEQDAVEQRKIFFARHYHTTLVGIIAGSVHAARAKTIPTVVGDHSTPAHHDGAVPHNDRRRLDSSTAVARAQSWLEELLARAQSDATSSAATFCHILVGWWTCAAMLGTSSASAGIVEKIWQALVDRDAELAAQTANLPPSLKLATGALLASQGLVVPSLQEFMEVVAAALNALPEGDTIDDLLLCEKRVILHALGLHPAPRLAGYAEVMAFARGLSLSDPKSTIEELLLRIESLTGYGTNRVDVAATDSWIQEMLCGLAMQFLRSYDFLTACRVLRAIAYLGLDDGADFKACLSFIRLHQRPNGAFGFFGLEEAPLKAQGVDGLPLDARLYLPVTTACLLALCEGSGQPTWWLYNALSDGMKSPHPIFP